MTWVDWLIITSPQIIAAVGAVLGAYWARRAHQAVTGDVTPAVDRVTAAVENDIKPALAHVSDVVNGGGGPLSA